MAYETIGDPAPKGKMCSIAGCERPKRARGWCKMHYNAWYNHGDPLAEARSPTFICSAEGCDREPRSRTAHLCDMHYCRVWRTGSLELYGREPQVAIEHEQGYVLEYAPDHPIATKKHPHVYEHRRVFYDAHGPGPHRCHWCSKWVVWRKLHVDHKDGVKNNNRVENLVPACATCNMSRAERSSLGGSPSPNITFNGVTKTRAEWARQIGIKSSNLQARLDSGWPLERALTEPRGKAGRRSERQLPLF